MHAAKGSQNGYDHSAPPDPGKSYWGQYRENIDTTLDAVEFLAKRYKDDPAFLGIGLLNEPAGTTTT
jgi:glucan 1,3-beta-glucosidase